MIVRPATEADREVLKRLSDANGQAFTDPWFWYNISSLVATTTDGEIVGGMTARPVAEIAMVLDWKQTDVRRGKAALAMLAPTLQIANTVGYDLAHAPFAQKYGHLSRALAKRGFEEDPRKRMIFDLVKWRNSYEAG
ncbi:MAG TPA: hypothetical protein VIY48_04870 [Candidatus Paceibacterota bacterium]